MLWHLLFSMAFKLSLLCGLFDLRKLLNLGNMVKHCWTNVCTKALWRFLITVWNILPKVSYVQIWLKLVLWLFFFLGKKTCWKPQYNIWPAKRDAPWKVVKQLTVQKKCKFERLGPFWPAGVLLCEFAYSPCACVGFVWLPSTILRHACLVNWSFYIGHGVECEHEIGFDFCQYSIIRTDVFFCLGTSQT